MIIAEGDENGKVKGRGEAKLKRIESGS